MEVFFSDLAKDNLKNLTNYLLEQWGYKVKQNFIAKLDKKIEQISVFPESCPKSLQFGGIYKCIVTKQITFFYRVNFDRDEIEVIALFDTRQDLDKLRQTLE